MGTKSALKRLKKKSKITVKTLAQKQLALLKNNDIQGKGHSHNQPTLSTELKGVTYQALQSAVCELSAPLTPVLSWFNEGGVTESYQSEQPKTNKIRSIAYLPLKSPPCKRCPALSNGVCKCALKQMAKSA
ncbi:hypothetical protein [Aliivibrio kagoshimensis]|uniref:hypothetical protein n=1 Tax=Aliivibrio kagoshimensis TaxID=2910230 RepID=UPI003D10FC5F